MTNSQPSMELPDAHGSEYELTVPACYGKSFEVENGQYLTVTDVEGRQVGDFVAFNLHDVTECLSTAHTRLLWGRIYPEVGDLFISNSLNSMLSIVSDDVGRHDVVRAICNPVRYLRDFGVADHRSCQENLVEVLESYGVARWWLPMPLNIFQNTPVMSDGRFETRAPLSKPGDRLVMRAHMDLVCGLSACPMDLAPTNDGANHGSEGHGQQQRSGLAEADVVRRCASRATREPFAIGAHACMPLDRSEWICYR